MADAAIDQIHKKNYKGKVSQYEGADDPCRYQL